MAKLKNIDSCVGNALEEAVSPMESALRNASDIVITLDASSIVETVSLNSASQSLGPLDHWQGRSIDDLLSEECRPKLSSRLKSLRNGEETVFNNIELNLSLIHI